MSNFNHGLNGLNTEATDKKWSCFIRNWRER